jgi:hypothetical protein
VSFASRKLPERVWRVECMSDYTPLKTLKRREVYECVYRPIQIDHFMMLAVSADGRRRGVAPARP